MTVQFSASRQGPSFPRKILSPIKRPQIRTPHAFRYGGDGSSPEEIIVRLEKDLALSRSREGSLKERLARALEENQRLQRCLLETDRLIAVDEANEEAHRKMIEIRAEAAMLVETVEDRAFEAVQAARRETDEAVTEIKRLKRELKHYD